MAIGLGIVIQIEYSTLKGGTKKYFSRTAKSSQICTKQTTPYKKCDIRSWSVTIKVIITRIRVSIRIRILVYV